MKIPITIHITCNNSSYIKFIKSILKRDRYLITGTSKTGRETLSHIRKEKPLILIIDIELDEDMNGIETANRAAELNSMAVIFIADKISSENIDAIRNMYCYDIVFKPLSEIPLNSYIELACRRINYEKQITESETKYRLLADNSTDVIWTMDFEGRLTYVSPSVKDKTGLSPEQVLKLPPYSFVTPESASLIKEEINSELNKPEGERVISKTVEIQYYRTDGSVIETEATTSWLYDVNGNLSGVQGIARDITDRKLVEKKLARKNAHIMLVNELNSDLDTGNDLNDLIKKACDGLKKIHNLLFADIWLFKTSPDNKNYLQLGYSNIDSSILSKAEKLTGVSIKNLKIPLFDTSLFKKFYDSMKPWEFREKDEIISLIRDFAHPEKKILRSLAPAVANFLPYNYTYLIPVIIEKKMIGHFAFNRENQFEVDEKDDIKIIVDKISTVIHRKQTELELISAREKSEMASRAKIHFLARMSHEIRTPINAILGMNELALMSDSDIEIKNYLVTVKSSINHLNVIINDILDFSRIEENRLTLQNENFEIIKVLNSSIDTLRIMADKKNISLKLELNRNLKHYYKGDKARIIQILINLVSNSIKFTKKGSIKVTVKENDYDPVMGEKIPILFTVEDTGIGIKKNQLDVIFDSFSQLDESYTRRHGGLGLGLAISKNLVDLHGGKIWVESNEGIGSKFSCILYLEKGEESSTIKPGSEKTVIPHRSLNILIAEDNRINAKVLTSFLNKIGHKSTVSHDGLHTIKSLKTGEYDLVLMDVEMPNLNGIDATKKIRQGEAGENNMVIPVIALTAHGQPEVKEECIKAGMDEFIMKPFDMVQFTGIINRVVENKRN